VYLPFSWCLYAILANSNLGMLLLEVMDFKVHVLILFAVSVITWTCMVDLLYLYTDDAHYYQKQFSLCGFTMDLE
jgi:hypothetical protein